LAPIVLPVSSPSWWGLALSRTQDGPLGRDP
jgi:hypothetical protein